MAKFSIMMEAVSRVAWSVTIEAPNQETAVGIAESSIEFRPDNWDRRLIKAAEFKSVR